jgi:hypothetical protein
MDFIRAISPIFGESFLFLGNHLSFLRAPLCPLWFLILDYCNQVLICGSSLGLKPGGIARTIPLTALILFAKEQKSRTGERREIRVTLPFVLVREVRG